MENQTLIDVFIRSAAEQANNNAFYYFSEAKGDWQYLNWCQYLEKVRIVASWLHGQGVRPGDRVGLLSGNRPEWIISDLAILWCGGVSVPIYATSSEKEVCFIAEHAAVKIFFVDTAARLQVLRGVSGLASIVLFDQVLRDSVVTDFSCQVFAMSELDRYRGTVLSQPTPRAADELATIVYTSGTTGTPKGVMHSHRNLVLASDVVKEVLLQDKTSPDRFFSFLPLSHVAERILVEVGSIATGSEVAFARSVSTLSEDLLRCRPTILLCVPRLWEKIFEKIQIQLQKSGWFRRKIFSLAEKLGAMGRISGDRALVSGHQHWMSKLSDWLVGKSLRAKLGLDRARILATGSAPTRKEVVAFFASFGLYIREVYGLTENLCLGVLSEVDISFHSCGKPFVGNELKIAKDGEILFRAPWMFTGYYRNEVASKEVLSTNGWFATGDLGEVDQGDALTIVGRKKELLKTSTGKYVAPVPIEDRLKALPSIQEAMLVGDNQKYCIALLTVDAHAEAKTLMHSIANHLHTINRDLANHEAVKRVGIVMEGFSIENGTLTPTLKVRRKAAVEKYQGFIDRIYAASETVVCEDKGVYN